MMPPSAIFSVLLAMLLVFVPAPCLCPPHSTAAAKSCCVSNAPSASQHIRCPLCASQADTADDQSLATRDSDKTRGSHCRVHCSCHQAPSMVAHTPPTLPAFTPVELPMAIWFEVLSIRPDRGTRCERLAAFAPARPVVTLLRLQCALII